jgi:hypothetical protein
VRTGGVCAGHCIGHCVDAQDRELRDGRRPPACCITSTMGHHAGCGAGLVRLIQVTVDAQRHRLAELEDSSDRHTWLCHFSQRKQG